MRFEHAASATTRALGASGAWTRARASGAPPDQRASERCRGGTCVSLVPGQACCAGAEWSG
ncbi:hypothetical protein [Sandaracinus amylolyticus]|nr:hypothetical protein [Sandaracinus amylolyticus]